MDITLRNGGSETVVELPHATEAGHIRTLREELDEIGVSGSYSLAVNGVGVEDNTRLENGSVVTFRPIQGTKGA